MNIERDKLIICLLGQEWTVRLSPMFGKALLQEKKKKSN